MKSLVLLKQRALYGEEKEDASYLVLKRELNELKTPLNKTAVLLKSWLDNVNSLAKTTTGLAEPGRFKQSEDSEMIGLASQIQNSVNNSTSGVGLVEVALDSVNRKLALVNDLAKKESQLGFLHLELSRANRKSQSGKDDPKYAEERMRLQQDYDVKRQALVRDLEFIHAEVAKGFLIEELQVFKAAQYAFFTAGAQATSTFAPSPNEDLTNIWARFTERQASAPGGSLRASVSGRNLFNQGMSDTSLPRDGSSSSGSRMAPPPPPPTAQQQQQGARFTGQTSGRMAPPPPPPPPPAPAAVVVDVYEALYDYEAVQSDELSFNAGEKLKMVNASDANWWEMEDSVGSRGMVPSNYLIQL